MGKPAKRRSSRAAPTKKLVIRNANGTYFWKWTVIGPYALRAEVFAPGRVPDQAVLDAFESYRARVRSAAGLDPEGA